MSNLGTTFQKIWEPPGKSSDHSNNKNVTYKKTSKELWDLSSFCLSFTFKRLVEDMMTVFICLESSYKEEEEFVFFLSGITGKQVVGLNCSKRDILGKTFYQ